MLSRSSYVTLTISRYSYVTLFPPSAGPAMLPSQVCNFHLDLSMQIFRGQGQRGQCIALADTDEEPRHPRGALTALSC